VRFIGETHPYRSHAIRTGDTAQIIAIQFDDMNGHWAYSLRRTGTIWSPLDSYDLYYDDELELVEREVESFYE
jgi:hypothetical protein